MPLLLLVATLIERILNQVLWQDRALKPARHRLNGRVLALYIRDIQSPLFLVFSERQVDVLTAWEGAKDCQITFGLAELRELLDKQQVTRLLKLDRIDVEGDLQIVQQFSALLDLAEWDPANFLSTWLGDIPAEQITRSGKDLALNIQRFLLKAQQQASDLLQQEWKVVPNALEIAWFCEETAALENALDEVDERLKKQENT